MMLLSVLIQYLLLFTDGLNRTNDEVEVFTVKNSAVVNTITKANTSVKVKHAIVETNTPITRNKPVRLNTRQGLIMNQVLKVYALDDVENSLCMNHSLEFKDALRAFEPWALKMFDSSSKLQSGILIGNFMEFGSFKQCIYTEGIISSGVIKGKQCTLKITPSMNLVRKILSFRSISEKRFEKIEPIVEDVGLYWSVCIPDSCTNEDVLDHFNKQLIVISEGLNINVSLDEIDCFSLKNAPVLTRNQYIAISTFLIIICMSLLCSLIEICSNKENKKDSFLVDIFSFYKNANYIFSYRSDDPLGLGCIHGIRVLSTAYVVLGHRFMMSLFAPSVNSLELLEWLLKYSSTIIIGATVSVDSFFMISGFLVTYYTLDLLTVKKGKLNWFTFYLYRFIRLTPPYALAIIVFATLIQFSGSGPLWRRLVTTLQKPCQYFWWSALLNIQNYVNSKYICIVQTWYLTNDFFYYMLSPLLIYPLWKWKIAGWINLLVFYTISVLVNFYLAWKNKYGAGMMVTNRLIQTDYFAHHYIAPHVRASTYILGIMLAAIIYRTKYTKIKLHPVTVTIGWMWSSILMLTPLLANHQFQLEDHDYNRLETSMYLSMSRSSWTVGLMWVVWACKHGYGGPVNHFLSHPIFQVLGKLTYSIFIWHLPMQFLQVAALKSPAYFADFNAISTFGGDMLVQILVSILYTIFFECPCIRLIRHLKCDDKKVTDKSIRNKSSSESKSEIGNK